MSDYPMLISNKLHSFRNFKMQVYKYNSLAEFLVDGFTSRMVDRVNKWTG